jgi:hypothetical protein
MSKVSFFIFVFFTLLVSGLRAQPTVNYDTISMSGIRAGEPLRDLGVNVLAPIDTMLWGGDDGASLLKFDGKYLGLNGEFRIATQGTIMHQITFSVMSKDSIEAAKVFTKLETMLQKKYGEPDDSYTNVYKMVRWMGQKQSYSLQSKDGTNYVSIVLTELASKKVIPR